MTRRLYHITALSCALVLVVALACTVLSPEVVAWAAGFGALAALRLWRARS